MVTHTTKTQDVGARIRTKRKELKMNQKALADLLGISQPEMSNIEKGKRPLTSARVAEVAGALKCDPTLLSEGEAGSHVAEAGHVGVGHVAVAASGAR